MYRQIGEYISNGFYIVHNDDDLKQAIIDFENKVVKYGSNMVTNQKIQEYPAFIHLYLYKGYDIEFEQLPLTKFGASLYS